MEFFVSHFYVRWHCYSAWKSHKIFYKNKLASIYSSLIRFTLEGFIIFKLEAQ